MATLNGFDVETGERVFDPGPGNEARNEAFREDLYSTPEWVELQSKFDLESGMEIVNAVIDSVPGPKLLSQVQSIVKKIVLAGGITRFGGLTRRATASSEEVAEETEIPVDRNGRPLTQEQIAWGEMARWSDTVSSRDRQERRRTDLAYATFYRKNLEREMHTAIGDAAENLNEPVALKARVAEELREFASILRQVPAVRWKPVGGYVVLDESHRYTKLEFDALVEKAVQAGLEVGRN